MKQRIDQINVSNDNMCQRLTEQMTRIANIFLICRKTMPCTRAFWQIVGRGEIEKNKRARASLYILAKLTQNAKKKKRNKNILIA